MVTAAALKSLFPNASPALVAAIVDNWDAAATILDSPLRVEHFLARVGVETGGLRLIEESLNYTSAARIHEVWPSHFATVAAAKPYVRKPQALAIHVYGGRMGNAPEPATDGWDFRGGGMLQTTGRDGYRAMGFEDNPEALRDPVTAFKTAVTEWEARGCNEMADRDDVVAICKAINGGTNGLEEQKTYLARAKALFTSPVPDAPIPAAPPVVVGPAPSLVEATQKALIAKGYHEVGEPDGKFGTKSRGAILAFEADHQRELTGVPSPDLLAAILASDPRPVSEDRAEGKPADNPVMKIGNGLKALGATVAGGSLLSTADPVVSSIEHGAGLYTRLKDALAPIIAVWPLLAVAAGIVILVLAIRSNKAMVKDYRTGKLAR